MASVRPAPAALEVGRSRPARVLPSGQLDGRVRRTPITAWHVPKSAGVGARDGVELLTYA